MLGFCLVLGMATLIAAVFAFAAEKIASTSRPDAVLLTDKDITTLRKSIRKPAPNPPTTPPAANE